MAKLGPTRFVHNNRTSTVCFSFGWKVLVSLKECVIKVLMFWGGLCCHWVCCPFCSATQLPVRVQEEFLCLHFLQLFKNKSLLFSSQLISPLYVIFVTIIIIVIGTCTHEAGEA